MKENQEVQVLRFIDANGSISSMEAFEHLHITRLAARIHDIERHGVVIDRETVRTDNGTWYTRYRRAN